MRTTWFFALPLIASLALPLALPLAGRADDAAPIPPRRMAVTVDDLPQNSRITTVEHRRGLNERLLSTLRREGIRAVGFVNASKCYVGDQRDEAQRALLADWLDAGMELGNHTWSHPSYARVDLATYTVDLERGEPLLQELLAEHGATLRWFRHPFLHRGDTDEKREALEQYLRTRGLREAPVTIDNGEWVYAAAYDDALIEGDRAAAERLATSYVQYMLDVVDFWEGQSQQLFGRNIAHVLLIHANTINADHLGTLLSKLRERGTEFITLDEALQDEAYATEDRYSGRAGISWLHRWALTRGVDRATFRDEPVVPEWVERAAER